MVVRSHSHILTFLHPYIRTSSEGAIMRKSSVATACTLAGVIAVLSFAAQPAAAQGASTAAKTSSSSKAVSGPPARTPWGDPDLQGTWSTDSAFGIPLQRPAEFAGRADVTDDGFQAK